MRGNSRTFPHARFGVSTSVWFPRSLRNVGGFPVRARIDLCHETKDLVDRFGPMFVGEIP